MMAERFKFRYVREITGLFVIGIVLLLIGAVAWTARSQRWFKSTVTVRIILPEAGAAGIRQGSEVYVLGTLVGSISDVEVDSTGRMEAHARVRRDFFLFMRTDSSAVVKKKFGVAGDSFFEITRGVGKPLPEQNASIVCNEQFQSGFETALEEVRSEAVSALKNANATLAVWKKFGTELSATRGDLDRVIARWENIAAGMEEGKGTVGQLLSNPQTANDLAHALSNADTAITESRILMTNLNRAAANVLLATEKLPEIGDALAAEAEDLPGLVEQTQRSMREMERLIVAMEHHWLVRKYVNKYDPPPPLAPERPKTSPKKNPLVPDPR